MGYEVIVMNRNTQSYDSYSEEAWAEAVSDWRKELLCGQDFEEYVEALSDAEVFFEMFGTRVYFRKIVKRI